jgi:hypothetical protein
MAVVISTPRCSMTGAVAFTISMAWAEAVRMFDLS